MGTENRLSDCVQCNAGTFQLQRQNFALGRAIYAVPVTGNESDGGLEDTSDIGAIANFELPFGALQ